MASDITPHSQEDICMGRQPSISQTSWAFWPKGVHENECSIACTLRSETGWMCFTPNPAVETVSHLCQLHGPNDTQMTAVQVAESSAGRNIALGTDKKDEQSHRHWKCRRDRKNDQRNYVKWKSILIFRAEAGCPTLVSTMGDRWWRSVSKITSLFQVPMKMGMFWINGLTST